MRFNRVRLASLKYALPEESWSSEYIEEELSSVYDRLKLPQGRLEMMTGIQARRVWPKGFRSSEAAILAAQQCLAENPIDPQEIGLLVHASVCRDFMEPATATVVHKALGLSPQARVFDLSNACLGFLNAMEVTATDG